jgi:hypothetical protein
MGKFDHMTLKLCVSQNINVYCLFLISAVYFEQKEYKKCIEQCEKAVEVGRENRADFKLIAKAFSRIGNSHLKLGVRALDIVWLFILNIDV